MANWQSAYSFANGILLKNRFVFAPISTMTSTKIGQLTAAEMTFYESRSHNVGMVILGSANISHAGRAYDNNVSIAHDAVIPNLKKYNQKVGKNGAKSIIQLYHGGATVPNHTLSEKEILEIIADFGKAIKRAIRAGFDGIEIHAANPFLLQQFLSPRTNQRTDFWGGDLKKRTHFLEAVLRLAIKIVRQEGIPFIIGVRLSLEEAAADGLRFSDTLEIVHLLSVLEIDYLHFNQHNAFEKNDGKPKLLQIEERLQSPVTVIGNGGIFSAEQLNEALEISPLVSAARALILEKEFPDKDCRAEDLNQISKENLLVPDGLWKSIKDSPDWYLNK